MTAVAHKTFADRLPDQVESDNAAQLRHILAAVAKDDGNTELHLAEADGKTQTIVLTPALTEALLDLLRLVSSGRGFRMIPVEAELTTQQAADLLNVSRPYLIKLLDEGAIDFRKVGRHRRVRAEDLFAYKAQRDEDRASALSHLARQDAEDGLI